MSGCKKNILVGVTGASGMIFLQVFIEECSKLKDLGIHGISSESGEKVLAYESGICKEDLTGVDTWFDIGDFGAPPASGSQRYEAMVVLPCTMGTLAAIAGGLSHNLTQRSADVMLKERRRLVLAVRENPFNRTHIENMLKAHDAGAIISPIMPGYYLKPKTIEDAARTYAWRVMDLLGLQPVDRKRWEGG